MRSGFCHSGSHLPTAFMSCHMKIRHVAQVVLLLCSRTREQMSWSLDFPNVPLPWMYLQTLHRSSPNKIPIFPIAESPRRISRGEPCVRITNQRGPEPACMVVAHGISPNISSKKLASFAKILSYVGRERSAFQTTLFLKVPIDLPHSYSRTPLLLPSFLCPYPPST